MAGNRLTEGENGNVTAYSTTDANPNAFGSLNQYTTITGLRGESAIKYDLDGNLTQDGTWTYAYDGENRLKSATKTGQMLTFMYDHAGRRIAKTVNGVTTTFLWQGWQLAAELGSDGMTPQKTFVWGRDSSDAQGNAGGAGALLAQLNVGSISYAIPDAYGSIVGYLQDGALVAAVEFSPYGKGVNAFGTWQSHPIGYAGQYMDWETGLAYYGLRYHAPKHGRFLNRDPIEEAGGNNLYGFVGNAPTRSWDVLGMSGRRDFVLRMAPPRRREGAGGTINGVTVKIDLRGEDMYSPFTQQGMMDQLQAHIENQAAQPHLDPTAILWSVMGPTIGDSGGLSNLLDSLPATKVEIGAPTLIELGGAGDPNSALQQAQATAAQLGWNGFTTNLSESQQLYYGKTAADILALQAQGKDVSALWKAVVGEVPGVIVDSNGNMAGDSADLARTRFLIGAGALGTVTVGVAETLARIARGESHPHRNDGAVFRNDQGRLPRQAPGYYREYVVPTQGNPGPGLQRVVIGQQGEVYYTANHYRTFTRVPVGGGGGGGKQPGPPGGG